MNTIFHDHSGKPVYVLGLQAHNSSNGNQAMIARSIQAVQLYHGNTLEVPVYWASIEPEEGTFDFTTVDDLLHQVRQAGLHLILLWFGFSKNCDATYTPAWVKQHPEIYRLAKSYDGGVVPMLSPHCEATITADTKAFTALMAHLRQVDEQNRTVLALQVENEIGLYPTDRCYSNAAQAAYDLGVPEHLQDILVEGSGASRKGTSWADCFGRFGNEAFSAWAFATAIERIASAGQAAYPSLPLFMNTVIGQVRQEIGGQSYPSGSPVGRMLPIWQRCAPTICLYGPDIYLPTTGDYMRVCKEQTKHGNPLFIPETGTAGEGFARSYLHAAAEYGALGICGFGAESTIDGNGGLQPPHQAVADSMHILSSMAPLLLAHGGTDRIFCVTQEEFQSYKHVLREKYHITCHFTAVTGKGHPLGRSLPASEQLAKNPDIFRQRGRVLFCEAAEDEFYLAGIGATVRFLLQPDPEDPHPMRTYASRAATELTAISVEEGHFDESGAWVCDFVRMGDEIDLGAFVYPGIVLRVKLNPDVVKAIEW